MISIIFFLIFNTTPFSHNIYIFRNDMYNTKFEDLYTIVVYNDCTKFRVGVTEIVQLLIWDYEA